MQIWVVTKGFKNPRYVSSKGLYCGAFSSVDAARAFINFQVEDDQRYFDTVITREFTTEDGTIYIEGRHRDLDQYFNYAIQETEVN